MVKWRGRLRRGRAEDGKLRSHLEWPKANFSCKLSFVDSTASLAFAGPRRPWIGGFVR